MGQQESARELDEMFLGPLPPWEQEAGAALGGSPRFPNQKSTEWMDRLGAQDQLKEEILSEPAD